MSTNIKYLYLTQSRNNTTISLKKGKKNLITFKDILEKEKTQLIPCQYQKYDEIKQFTQNDEDEPIPFPPYNMTINDNFQFTIYLCSLFCTLIGNKTLPELGKSKLLRWLYFYRTNYPYMPNIYDLYRLLSIRPEDIPKGHSSSFDRYILHNFCKLFSTEFNFPITELTIAIPRKPNALRNINSNLLIFIPLLCPISSIDTLALTTEIENKREYIPFPTSITIPNGDEYGSTNFQNEIYQFLGGIFQSTKTGEKFVVLMCSCGSNQNKLYYKYSSNCCFIKQSPEIMYKSSCLVAFFIKTNQHTNFVQIYQKIDSSS